jgi:site-specific DNA-cytosine methylase
MINKKCIVRGDRSGVFFGTVKEINGQTVVMENVRRLWYWDGANSISDLAIKGTKKPSTCKFTKAVENVIITDVIEINQCSDEAITNLENVKAWTF